MQNTSLPIASETEAGKKNITSPVNVSPNAKTVVQNVSVAQLVLQYLRLENTPLLFGVPGAAVMQIMNQLRIQQNVFTYVITKHETGAAYMADGYSRTSGNLGVVLVTAGPGAVNAVTGAMNAQQSYSPVLVISGEVPTQYFGKGYVQEGFDGKLNVNEIYEHTTAYSIVIPTAQSFQTLFTQALRVCRSLPCNTAHISIPQDVAGVVLPSVNMPNSPACYRTTPSSADPKQVKAVLDKLVMMERPLIFLGNGVRRALQGERLEKFISFVETFGIPVMTTVDGKALFPENHPLSLRNYGQAACQWINYYLSDPDYDMLLVMGSSLGEYATAIWNPILVPSKFFVQVDLDQTIIGRGFPVQMGVVAEVGAFIDELIEQSKTYQPFQKQERLEFITSIQENYPAFRCPNKMEANTNPMLPQALMKTINKLIPPGSHIFADSGNCVGWTLHYLTLAPPTQIHYSLAMGPVGCAVPAVIGGKMGAPDKTCIAIVGDGAFLMHGTEVSTAALYKVGAVWIVLADFDYGMVSQGMGQFFPDIYYPEQDPWADYYKLGNSDMDLAAFAKSMGADAYDAYTTDDVREILPKCIADADTKKKPQVIIAHINTKEVPPYYPPKPNECSIAQ